MVEASGEACREIWWQRECAGRNVSERRASLEKDVAQADPTAISGKADTTGEVSEEGTQWLRRGSSDSMYTREAHATREAPWRGIGMTNRTPVRERPGALGWRRGP